MTTAPITVRTDDALSAIWSQHLGAKGAAGASKLLAEPFEQSAIQRRAKAKGKREEADKLLAAAAEEEALAAKDDHTALLHRGDEKHHDQVAADLGNAAAGIAEASQLMHPAERAQRLEQAAAANLAAQATALDAPLVPANHIASTQGIAAVSA